MRYHHVRVLRGLNIARPSMQYTFTFVEKFNVTEVWFYKSRRSEIKFNGGCT